MKPKILLVTTSPFIVNQYLRGHLNALSREYDVTLAVNTRDPYRLQIEGIDCRILPLSIERKIAPLADLVALISLWRHMAAGGYALVHSFAPKAGLLSMIAGRLARVPHRVHTFQGEVWVTRSGMMRRVLKFTDRLTARFATRVLVVGEGERRFLIREQILDERSLVLANGSIAGVDMARFRPNALARARIRQHLGIPESGTVLLFLGRIARDKGILDLAGAFAKLAQSRPGLHLVIAGPDEEDLQRAIVEAAPLARERIYFPGLLDNPEDWLAAADVLCLPSYREGFPVAILEAAAIGIPSLGSNIYGVSDAIVDGRTGLLHEPASAPDIAAKLSALVDDPRVRRTLGENARERVMRDFPSERVIGALLAFYRSLIRAERPARTN